jgi:hypothetical protein
LLTGESSHDTSSLFSNFCLFDEAIHQLIKTLKRKEICGEMDAADIEYRQKRYCAAGNMEV